MLSSIDTTQASQAYEMLISQIMQIERRFAADPSRGAKERQAEIRSLIERAANKLKD